MTRWLVCLASTPHTAPGSAGTIALTAGAAIALVRNTVFGVCIWVAFSICSGVAQAAPITLAWSDTVSAGSTLVTGVSIGDPFTFSIVVDNGGATTTSQTWTAADFVSASINVDAGAYTGMANNPVNSSSSGVFQTDAGGNVIAVPSSWVAIPGNGTDSNGLTDIDWFINGNNGVWVRSPEFDMDIWATNVGGNQVAANWTAVPEPTSGILVGFGLLGCLVRRKRRNAAMTTRRRQAE
jgi:PEP-CTERM motif